MENEDKIVEVKKVAWLVYKLRLSQREVSKRLSMSRSTVSRLLKKAKDLGIVEIRVNLGNELELFRMENDIKNSFGIKEVIIAPLLTDEKTDEAIALKAADYLVRNIKKNDVIGVAWGNTLFETIKHIPANLKKGGKVVSLIGGMGNASVELHSNYLGQELARKISAQFFPIYAPAIIGNKLFMELIYKENSIKQTIDLIGEVRIALVGIGSINPNSTIVKTGYFKVDEFLDLKKRGIVGDICSYFFNREGNIVRYYKSNVVGINVEKLKQIPLVVGIAGGEGKAEAIYSALRGRLINVLVTDEKCAKAILKLSEDFVYSNVGEYNGT
jgi:DNA-binding transcriptional regulator LsrR (DeoR family)